MRACRYVTRKGIKGYQRFITDVSYIYAGCHAKLRIFLAFCPNRCVGPVFEKVDEIW